MIAIVGGGPAALGAAIACQAHALVLERNPRPGTKLLLSGSGQCNFTNARPPEEFLNTLGAFRNWLKPAFYAFDNRAFINLLEDHGCPVFIRADKKAFPQSLKSADVLETLLRIAKSGGAEFMLNRAVQSIVREGDGFQLITADGSAIHAHQVIIAAGGASWPHTGSDGASYRFAESLGHTILKPRPALASVEIRNYAPFSKCAGISLRASLRLGKFKVEGDLLFTHKGFSGPLIIDNSWQMEAGQRMQLGLADAARFTALVVKQPRRRISSLIHELGLPQSLVQAMFEHLNIPGETTASQLKREHRELIASWLEGAEFSILKVESLATAMSDYGGVELKEINSKTMQSRLFPGLFFAGESMAYSLPSGGFSIQMAFSTGYLAGKSAMNCI